MLIISTGVLHVTRFTGDCAVLRSDKGVVDVTLRTVRKGLWGVSAAVFNDSLFFYCAPESHLPLWNHGNVGTNVWIIFTSDQRSVKFYNFH